MNEIAGPVSKSLFETAKKLLPGGVASPVRAIQPYPFYTVSASGSHLTTVEGTTYIDCCLGYGPLLLGHKNPVVKKAIEEQLENGWLFGTPSEREIQLAQLITRDYPSMDMLRFVSTGCEATMSAIRLARGFTGKSGIVKVKGGFHGAHDSMLVSAGSGAASRPDSLGIPPQVQGQLEARRERVRRRLGEPHLAAVLDRQIARRLEVQLFQLVVRQNAALLDDDIVRDDVRNVVGVQDDRRLRRNLQSLIMLIHRMAAVFVAIHLAFRIIRRGGRMAAPMVQNLRHVGYFI